MAELSERKQRFVDEAWNFQQKKRVLNLLQNLDDLEKKMQFDFCLLTEHRDISFVVAEITPSKLAFYLRFTLKVLNLYCEWCIVQKYTDWNAVGGIKDTDIDLTHVIKRDMFASSADFSKYLRRERLPLTPDNICIMYYAYYWAIFLGLLPDEACTLKKSDVSIDGTTLNYNGEQIHIVDEAQYPFRLAATMQTILYGRRETPKPVYQSEKLFVNLVKEMTPNDFWRLDLRYKKRFENRLLDWGDVYWSGMFVRIYKDEAKGRSFDFGNLFADMLERPGKLNDHLVNYRKKVKDIENLYFWWKKAFHL